LHHADRGVEEERKPQATQDRASDVVDQLQNLIGDLLALFA
jgi:hypothetical protein